jgi:hypothetical protein
MQRVFFKIYFTLSILLAALCAKLLTPQSLAA